MFGPVTPSVSRHRFAGSESRPLSDDSKRRFRARFKERLTVQVSGGHRAGEIFGRIWMEVLEEIPLTAREEGELYEPLIRWAKIRTGPDERVAPEPSGKRTPQSVSRPGVRESRRRALFPRC